MILCCIIEIYNWRFISSKEIQKVGLVSHGFIIGQISVHRPYPNVHPIRTKWPYVIVVWQLNLYTVPYTFADNPAYTPWNYITWPLKIGPFQKETIVFQQSIFRWELLVSGRVSKLKLPWSVDFKGANRCPRNQRVPLRGCAPRRSGESWRRY